MIFRTPVPFREAIESRVVRQLLPTELRTALLDTIAPELRERAVFSAGVTNAEFLQKASDLVDGLLNGEINRAEARTALKRELGTLGTEREDESDLTDLGSDARINMILDTNLEMAEGYGGWKQGQDAAILDLWPAQELVRVANFDAVARGTDRPWPDIWKNAGGTFYDGRMIALKNDPIWTRISRFGLPYPPFDFNSGMDVSDVDRETAIAARLIDRDTQVQPQDRPFNAQLKAHPDVRSQSLRNALAEALQGIATFDAGGVLRLVGGAS